MVGPVPLKHVVKVRILVLEPQHTVLGMGSCGGSGVELTICGSCVTDLRTQRLTTRRVQVAALLPATRQALVDSGILLSTGTLGHLFHDGIILIGPLQVNASRQYAVVAPHMLALVPADFGTYTNDTVALMAAACYAVPVVQAAILADDLARLIDIEQYLAILVTQNSTWAAADPLTHPALPRPGSVYRTVAAAAITVHDRSMGRSAALPHNQSPR